MSLVTVRLEDADDPDALLPVSVQLMAAVPRVGELLWLGGPASEYEVVQVSWRLHERPAGETEVDLVIRRVREPGTVQSLPAR